MSAAGTAFRIVGRSVPRSDGVVKTTGQATYASDISLPNMAYAKVLRSPVAHARIRSIDATAALRRPGVVAVVTGADLLRLPATSYGHAIRDHPVVAIDKVRYIGEPVAAIIAEDEATAQDALGDVVVDYEELAAVMTPEEALAPGAPLVHERRYEAGVSPGAVIIDPSKPLSNVCQENVVRFGDIEAAFARAALILEGDFYYPMTYAYPMESFVATADHADDGLTIYASAQHPFMVRSDVAHIFGLPLNRVRMITPFIGGGYGAKSYTKVEPLAALCSWKAKRPVRVQLTVEEAILTSRADDGRVHVKTAVDAKGKLIARQAVITMSTGAYAENGPVISAMAANRIVGAYVWDAIDITSYSVYTNTCPGSSYRGFGTVQGTLAGEIQIDEIAKTLGIDAVELRLRNLADAGQRVFPDMRGITADLKGDLRKVAEALGWGTTLPAGRGRGVAVAITQGGAQPVGSGQVRVHGDGSVTILTGSTEMGQGGHTVLAQIAAEEFGTTLDGIRVIRTDTTLSPFSRSTGADRTTTIEGRQVLEACRDAKERLRVLAAELWGVASGEVSVDCDGATLGGERMRWSEIIGRSYQIAVMEVTGISSLRQVGDLSELPVFWEVSIVGTEVAVDTETGEWRLERLFTVADLGIAINPTLSEGQDLGSATMGLGVALGEELVYEGQQLVNGSIVDYRLPRFSDAPREFRSLLVENRDGVGPYGAKGIGEGPTGSMCAAISNAIYNAVGVRLHEAPFTAERVWNALEEKER